MVVGFFDVVLVSNLYADWSRILMERQNYEELEQVFHVQPTTGCLIIHNGILILGKPWNLSGNQSISCPLESGSNSETRNSELLFFQKVLFHMRVRLRNYSLVELLSQIDLVLIFS